MMNMPQITLWLHNIRSTHNVGSIFRTAEGFCVKEIILSGYTPYPKTANDSRLPHIAEKLTTQIHKTALGAEKLVAFRYIKTVEECMTHMVRPLVALEQAENATTLRDYLPPNEFTLLLGEEVHGIDRSLLSQCDAIVEIPMKGCKESFNVSVAAGIALYGLQ